MSVFKIYKGRRITAKHPQYKNAKWRMYKRVRGGKPIHKSLPDAVTVGDAERAERIEIEKVFNRRYGISDRVTTFEQFADNTYLKYVSQNNVNITAKKQYVEILKKEFKNRLLSDITPQDCRDCQYKLQRKKSDRGKLSSASVNRIMSTLSKLFSLACEEDILDRNPMQYVKSLKEPPPRKRLLTPEQKQKLFARIERDDFLNDIVNLAVNLPLRKGQLLAITAEAIDFDRRTLTATGSKGREPRLVAMNEKVYLILKRLAGIYKTGELLRINGKPVKSFRKRWARVLISAGINEKGAKRGFGFTFHDLRKEFASELIRRNVNPKTVQDLFAHSSAAITDIYMQADLALQFEAVGRLDETIQESEEIN